MSKYIQEKSLDSCCVIRLAFIFDVLG